MQNIFKLPPVLEKMEEEKKRVTSPAMTFVRQLAIAVDARKKLGAVLKAGELADIAFDAGLAIPGLRALGDDEAAKKTIGMVMARAYNGEEIKDITADIYTVTRFKKEFERKKTENGSDGGPFKTWVYVFERSSPPVGPSPATPVPDSVTPPPATPASSALDEIESID